MEKKDYIAVFDSGLGGLSVLRQLNHLMPNENYYYFGDSANAPYGERSTENIRSLCEEALEKIREHGIKCFVIACNTATSAAIDYLSEKYPDIHFIGIEPAVKWAAETLDHPVVLTFATNFTINGDRYRNSVKALEGKGAFYGIGAPGFVEFVERGITDSTMMEECINYIDFLTMEKCIPNRVDAVVLGCTHFPFIGQTIKQEVDKITGGDAQLFDAAVLTAQQVFRYLSENDGLNDGTDPGEVVLDNSAPSKISLMQKLYES